MAQEFQRGVRRAEELRQLIGKLNDQLRLAQAELADIESGLSAPSLDAASDATGALPDEQEINQHSSAEAKLRLFRERFRGRTDAFATSWVSSTTGKKGWSPKTKRWVRPQEVTKADLMKLDDSVIYQHLKPSPPGTFPFHVGLYPLLDDDHCYLLACDFDKGGWQKDAAAYSAAAHKAGFENLVEVSRSGNGAHVWIFFSEKVPAVLARNLGARFLRIAMQTSTDLTLDSYDRLFPSQDTLPTKSAGANRLGNLIALPLEGTHRKEHRTVFVDPATFMPLSDPFKALYRIKCADVQQVSAYLRSHNTNPYGPTLSMGDLPPRQKRKDLKGLGQNEPIKLLRNQRLHIPTGLLPSSIVSELKHLACQANPEFYRRQAQRFSTYGVPRLVQCFTQDDAELVVPRGVTDECVRMLQDAGFKATVSYTRKPRTALECSFQGVLRGVQQDALDAILPHRAGVIVAPTGSGKTVMACALIAERKVPTAILVNNTQLLQQWRSSLETFLDIDPEQIGQLGDGRSKLTGQVDLIMVQSLRSRDADVSRLSGYGQVIVDECHSIAAPSTLAAVEKINALYWVGLTATPYRADALNGLITMQCGPIRFEAETSTGSHRELHVHETAFEAQAYEADGAGLQELYNELAVDEDRNKLISDLVAEELANGRHCLVLSNRTGQIHTLATTLEARCPEIPVIELHGKMSKKERKLVTEQLRQVGNATKAYAVIASEKIAGEGFDLPSLDTLFLVSPASFRGKVEQLIGRIQRSDDPDRTVRVHDFVDVDVPVFAHMARRRHRVISKKGFQYIVAPTAGIQEALTPDR